MPNYCQKSPKIYAAVLAAGEARRFGSTKQAETIGDLSMVGRAMLLANRCCGDNTLLVVGHDPATVIASAGKPAGFVVVNDRYRDGIGSSIATAAQSLRHVADAMLLLLADQVLITPQHIEALLAEWTGSDTHIVATAFGENSGPPVLLPRGAFGLLSELTGDRGAKALFSDSAFEFSTVRFDDAGCDIDTPGDLQRIVQRTGQA